MTEERTEGRIDFRTVPDKYRHWNLSVDGRVARLALDVDEQAALSPGYELKLNSYDLGVDIELHDALQRLRFEHPGVGAAILTSDKPRVFCAGANIRMLSQSSHAHKVNFCKFTNETRNGIEDASEHSGIRFVAAVNGACAGGGYELALACDRIMLIDDGSSTVSLPELPLLAVLPGTGGLTRLVDKRKVRRDRADFFCTTSEGVRGARAVDWNLVDEVVQRSAFDETVAARARGVRRADRQARRRERRRADPAAPDDRTGPHRVRPRDRGYRPENRDRRRHGRGAVRRAARRRRRDRSAGRRVLASGPRPANSTTRFWNCGSTKGGSEPGFSAPLATPRPSKPPTGRFWRTPATGSRARPRCF